MNAVFRDDTKRFDIYLKNAIPQSKSDEDVILRGSNCPASAKFVMCMIYAPTVILTVYSGNIAEIQADRRRCAFVSRAYP